MSSTTISQDWAYYKGANAGQPGWWALQNPWGNGSLVNGTNYTQSVTVQPSSFPNDTVLSWSWPNTGQTSHVYGYPELVYGAQAGTWASPDGGGPAPVQIDNLTALTGSFDLTLAGDTSNYDVLWETHLTFGA